MDPIIEILTKNIMADKNISGNQKQQFILTINRISSFETTVDQLLRQNSYHLLFNVYHEEIKFLENQKHFFAKILKNNVLLVFNDLIDMQIQIYNRKLYKL